MERRKVALKLNICYNNKNLADAGKTLQLKALVLVKNMDDDAIFGSPDAEELLEDVAVEDPEALPLVLPEEEEEEKDPLEEAVEYVADFDVTDEYE